MKLNKKYPIVQSYLSLSVTVSGLNKPIPSKASDQKGYIVSLHKLSSSKEHYELPGRHLRHIPAILKFPTIQASQVLPDINLKDIYSPFKIELIIYCVFAQVAHPSGQKMSWKHFLLF